MLDEPIKRRDFIGGALSASSGLILGEHLLGGSMQSAPIVFSILHTNDMHSNFLGLGPVMDYTPERSNPDDHTMGGYARLATLLQERKRALEALGPVLVLDAGDFTMGTALGAASRQTGAELRVMAQLGYDATTFGNHEFDFGPEGLGQIIRSAVDHGPAPAIVIANAGFEAPGQELAELRRLAEQGIVRPYTVITRGRVRFGLFGLIGIDAQKYTPNPGATRFDDPIATARTIVRQLRDVERVDVVICLSHGGVQPAADGTLGGEDLRLAEAVPEIDVVVGGHTHTLLETALQASTGAAVVQAFCYGHRLGELVFPVDRGVRQIRSFTPHLIDRTTMGDPTVSRAIEGFTADANRTVFASYGFEVLQPLAVVPEDLPSSFTDIAASTPLGNLVTDAIRQATGADVGVTANGTLRTGLTKGATGIQTVYDVFGIAPLGFGILDSTAGGALVTGYFSGKDLKSLMEFFLVDSPTLPGQYFPRVSGLRVYYDKSRPKYDQVTEIQLGDLESGYRGVDLASTGAPLYSVSCNIYVGVIVAAIPHLSGGQLALAPKNRAGAPLQSRVEALDDPRTSTGPYVLPPHGEIDPSMVESPAQTREIKEWKAVMDYLTHWPVKNADGLSLVQRDARLLETRVIERS